MNEAIVEELGATQSGIGTKNAVESILLGLNDMFQQEGNGGSLSKRTLYALCLDFSNAFNSVDRNTFLNEVHRLFPSLSRWVQYTYGCSAHLFVGKEIIPSTTGVQQGDPLGPLLFVLVLHVLLRQVKTQVSPDAQALVTVAYLDDVTMVHSSLEQLRDTLSIICLEGPRFGLFLSPTKSTLWSPFDKAISTYFPTNISTEVGIELLGGCVAVESSFMTAVAEKRVRN